MRSWRWVCGRLRPPNANGPMGIGGSARPTKRWVAFSFAIDDLARPSRLCERAWRATGRRWVPRMPGPLWPRPTWEPRSWGAAIGPKASNNSTRPMGSSADCRMGSTSSYDSSLIRWSRRFEPAAVPVKPRAMLRSWQSRKLSPIALDVSGSTYTLPLDANPPSSSWTSTCQRPKVVGFVRVNVMILNTEAPSRQVSFTWRFAVTGPPGYHRGGPTAHGDRFACTVGGG